MRPHAALSLSFSRQSKTISCQSTKRDEERAEWSGGPYPNLLSMMWRERERDGTSMDVMMLCRAEEKEYDGEK